MSVSQQDRSILRLLADQVAGIATLPIHAETIEGWKSINALEPGKPMVWINEIPWHEMDIDHELTLQCRDDSCRRLERELRRTLYQWRHMRADMVVEPVVYSPLVVHDTGFGIDEDVDIVRTDEASSIVSRRFHRQIVQERDVDKIKMPQITLDVGATEDHYARTVGVLGDILPVQKRGAPGFWFAPWDLLIRLWGVQEALQDLIMRPEFVHLAMDRLVSAYLHRLDQYEALGLLSLNNTNVRVGSGGLGYVDQLPQSDFDRECVRPIDLWGCATAQIFSDVSPRMHEEFALRYEKRWLERFGLNYYGCCEPLHLKVDMLRTIPRLRKISMSPWIDVETAAENVGTDFVFSLKPSPAILATDTWNPQRARDELRQTLERTRGCIVEIIMKDISTVRYEPQRLWEWAQIATEVTSEFA